MFSRAFIGFLWQSFAACALLSTSTVWSSDVAAQAVQASGRASVQASGHAVNALGASGRATLAVSAVPLAIGGSVASHLGAASTAVAEGLLQGSAAVGTPLPITDEVITVVPPEVALRQPARQAGQPLTQ